MFTEERREKILELLKKKWKGNCKGSCGKFRYVYRFYKKRFVYYGEGWLVKKEHMEEQLNLLE